MHHNLASYIDSTVWWEFNAVAGGIAYLTGLDIAASVHQCWESSFKWVQTWVTNERSSESAQPDDTACICAIFQPLVNSYTHTDPERLISPDKSTRKERSWLGLAQVPSVKMLYFLWDRPGKVWKSFCCSVFGQREVMDEQKPGARFCSQCKTRLTPQVAASLGW